MPPSRGILDIDSQPLGVGKTTVVQCLGRVLRLCPLAVTKATLECNILKTIRNTDRTLLVVYSVFELKHLGSIKHATASVLSI